jgi:hypothetical protein
VDDSQDFSQNSSKEGNSPNATPSPEAMKRLKELTDFFEKGILSAEEFKMLKDKIIKDGSGT